jgi:hypothetical protein
MSGSLSPASSLDYFESDASGSEAEYTPATHRRAANKRRPANAVAGPSTSTAPAGGKKALKIRINVGAASSSRAGAAMHPMEGDVEMDEEVEEQVAGVMGSRVMDLSNRELKKDHAARPLWVDEAGHMYVVILAIGYTDNRQYSRGIRTMGSSGSRLSYRHRRACLEVRHTASPFTGY